MYTIDTTILILSNSRKSLVIFIFQSGQYMLELVDHYGGTFLVLFCAIAEIVGVFYIYGNLCKLAQF